MSTVATYSHKCVSVFSYSVSKAPYLKSFIINLKFT